MRTYLITHKCCVEIMDDSIEITIRADRAQRMLSSYAIGYGELWNDKLIFRGTSVAIIFHEIPALRKRFNKRCRLDTLKILTADYKAYAKSMGLLKPSD